ncbi:MAG TPA: TraB/GumN family protein [Sphingomicrobium sp.]|nr:TraB/GumN family protein [Sphingomicrobium sp.]
MVTALIAVFGAAALSAMPVPRAPQPTPIADARPALWVVNDEDTIIYLFGTFHAHDGRSSWFNDEVETAFAASDQLVLETLVPEPLAERPAPPQGPVARLQPVGPFAGSASFLSTTRMVMSAGRSQGMSTDRGADSVLRAAAEQSGKPVEGLESFDFQLRMFSRMPGAPVAADPFQAARTKAALAAVLADLQAAWNRGDVERFAPMLEKMEASSPESYRQLFPARNARWAQWIARRLQQPGTVFVAVGAGHLAGKDSVQHKLAELRIRSQRIN